MRPPCVEALHSSARFHPEMVPATVLAATPPRNGMLDNPRSRYESIVAAPAAAPHASIARGGSPGAWITQNASPPIAFMCG